jgi:hypothetical protein
MRFFLKKWCRASGAVSLADAQPREVDTFSATDSLLQATRAAEDRARRVMRTAVLTVSDSCRHSTYSRPVVVRCPLPYGKLIYLP